VKSAFRYAARNLGEGFRDRDGEGDDKALDETLE
jgi:hypothetical protein